MAKVKQEGLTSIDSLDAAIRECERKCNRRSLFAIIFGALLVIITLSVLLLLAWLIAKGPVKAGQQTPALYVLLPTLAIISAFLAGLSRFHLRALSRYDDYGMAFARIKIAAQTTKEDERDVRNVLLTAPFSALGGPPDLDTSTLGEILNALAESGKPSKDKQP